MIAYEGPNAEQIRYWNEIGGPQWVALHETISAQIRPIGLRTIEHARIQPGERVLDVGCGIGETTLEIARRVGPRGRALGIDVSEPMLAYARENSDNLAHLSFEAVDAQTARLEADSFDVLFSRFGIMFFADPEAAFTNLAHALRPGARLAFVCWRAIQENQWMLIPAMAAGKHLPMKRPEPNAPGPFAYADRDRVRGFLERAGFVNVIHEPVDEPLSVAGGAALDPSVDFLLKIGPAAAALREAKPSPELAAAVRASIREAIAPFERPDGVHMPSAAWIVTAERGR